MNKREKNRSLYLSYLEFCNKHDVDGMAAFYTSTIKVNDVPMDPAAVAAQFAPLFSAFPDWHWEIRHLVVDGDNIAVHFAVTGTHRGVFREIEATNRRVTTSEFTSYHIENGKFAEGLGPHRHGRCDEADQGGVGLTPSSGDVKRGLRRRTRFSISVPPAREKAASDAAGVPDRVGSEDFSISKILR